VCKVYIAVVACVCQLEVEELSTEAQARIFPLRGYLQKTREEVSVSIAQSQEESDLHFGILADLIFTGEYAV
jgi:hypothetical protein